ncbi:MAB_1171c family putative transporter [Actinopolyspora sp. H202]|uniref:MAB_1171c family putative transporter n=1 Tax=Actinopolyspora sp. H202 TaxID=1500456 RepID=UPI003EE5DC78
MGVSVLFLATGFVVFSVAGYRIVLWNRGRRRPTEIPLITLACALGTAFVTLAPVVQAAESALLPSLGRLLSNTCTLVAAFGFLHLMLYVSHPAEQVPSKVRPRLLTLLLTLVGMTAMFALSDPPGGTGVFTGLYATQPTLAVYTLLYSLYLGTAVIELIVLTMRSIRYTRTWLRAGMILLALGSTLAAGYLAHKLWSVLSELLTSTIAEPYCPSAFATIDCTFAIGLPALSVLAIVLGAAVPTLGPRCEQLVRSLGHRRSYRRLYPLWHTLHTAMPSIAFTVDDTTRTPAPTRGGSEQLYRRVVAIRDGMLLLRPYRSAEDTRGHQAAARRDGVAEQDRAATVEARDIHTALSRHRRDTPIPDTERTRAAEPYDDLAAEISWLVRVSEALARHPTPPSTNNEQPHHPY